MLIAGAAVVVVGGNIIGTAPWRAIAPAIVYIGRARSGTVKLVSPRPRRWQEVKKDLIAYYWYCHDDDDDDDARVVHNDQIDCYYTS